MALFQAHKVSGGMLTASVAAGFLLAMGGAAVCGQWEQLHKLVPDDVIESDYFGWSLAVDGGLAAVGAPWGAASDVHSGAAYIFDLVTGEQLHKLAPDDPLPGQNFGSAVCISGDTIVVGAINDSHLGSQSGSAYVFNATTGEQLHKLVSDDPSKLDWFGWSVSVSGTTIVVGVYFDDDACPSNPDCNSGSVYVFDADTGEQIHKLLADDAAASDHFGASVSVCGDVIAVGSHFDDDAGDRSGSAYVFDAITGEQLHKLIAEDGAMDDFLGSSIAISGNTIVVGSNHDDDAGDKSGSAYVFDAVTGAQLRKLTAADAAEGDGFGYPVAIEGNLVVVGATGDDDACPSDPDCCSGSAYIFDLITGNQWAKLTADDAEGGDVFGSYVSIEGSHVVIGAMGDDDEAGAAYVFQAAADSCPADVSGPNAAPDGVVDVHDLLLILVQWGTAGPEGDFTGADGEPDGIVDVHDLLAVLGAWGPC